MLRERYPYYLANRAVFANEDLEVHDKYRQRVATRVSLADDVAIDEAIRRAVAAQQAFPRWPSHRRQEVLEHCVARFRSRQDELAHSLCVEAGKPIRDARGEVTRLIDTFRVAAEESVRITGEVMPLDISARAAG